MTETDTIDITTRSQLQTRDPNPSRPPPRNVGGSTFTSAAQLPDKWPTNKPGSSGKTGCCSLRDTPRSRNKRARLGREIVHPTWFDQIMT